MTWQADGTGIIGTTSATATAVGYVGEILTASPGVAIGSGSSGTEFNITSLSVTAGHWLLFAYGEYTKDGSTLSSYVRMGLSTVSATLQAGIFKYTMQALPSVFVSASFNTGLYVGPINLEISSPTTYYLVGMGDWSTATTKFSTNSQIKAVRIA